jgi:hypothetical protein
MINTLLEFTKTWLPSIGVIIAAFWVLFQWLYEQKLRKNKEMPALSGEITTEFTDYNEDKYILSIKTEWNNSSPLPIYVDTKKSRIDIFQINELQEYGYFEVKRDLGEPIYRAYPLNDMGTFIFEPSKNNQVRGNFLLKKGTIYYLRIKIYKDSKFHGEQSYAWTGEQIIDIRTKQNSNNG